RLVAEMAAMVRWWRLILDGDEEWFVSHAFFDGFPADGIDPLCLKPEDTDLRGPELFAMALFELTAKVSSALDRYGVSPSLSCNPLKFERRTLPPVRLHMRCDTLIGTMYWQFAQALLGGAKLKKCSHCSRLFTIAGGRTIGSHRTNKETCSGA